MPFLTVRQAAEQLGVGYSTLKQWIYKGRVRTTRTDGGHHRIAEAEVERLLARNGRAPSGRAPRRAGGGVLMVVSGRNRLRGIVDEVRRDGLIAQVRLRIGDQQLTAVITRDALDELRLKRGDEATALIKATEVNTSGRTTAHQAATGEPKSCPITGTERYPKAETSPIASRTTFNRRNEKRSPS